MIGMVEQEQNGVTNANNNANNPPIYWFLPANRFSIFSKVQIPAMHLLKMKLPKIKVLIQQLKK